MKPLYTELDFIKSKTNDKLPCECFYCHKPFLISKHKINDALNPKLTRQCKYCSIKCMGLAQNTSQHFNCTNCNLELSKNQAEIKKSKSNNHFCSRSCAATYNNKNKTHGTRRSKLEHWLQEQLTLLYPNLEIHFNQKSAINSELDIFVPSLRLAFELNGVFHYEPIYGPNKLIKIQANDMSKSKACHEAKIDLCIIDVSQQKYVKPSTSQKYLDIITDIIKERF